MAAAAVLLAAMPSAGSAATQADDVLIYGPGNQKLPLVTLSRNARVGDQFAAVARLEARNATTRMLVGLQIDCVNGDSTRSLTTTQILATTQNAAAGQTKLVLRGRYVVTAEHDGPVECTLFARGGDHGTDEDFFRVVGSGTSLSMSGVLPAWAKGATPPKDQLLRKNRRLDVAVMNADIPAAAFSVVADVELTNCYTSYSLCSTVPPNSLSATVRTRLVVQQYAKGGGYCNVTRFAAKKTTINRVRHHQKVYHSGKVQAASNPNCADRYRIKVYLRHLSGNPANVHGRPYTATFAR